MLRNGATNRERDRERETEYVYRCTLGFLIIDVTAIQEVWLALFPFLSFSLLSFSLSFSSTFWLARLAGCWEKNAAAAAPVSLGKGAWDCDNNCEIPPDKEAEVFEEIATMDFPYEGIPTIPPRKNMTHMVSANSALRTASQEHTKLFSKSEKKNLKETWKVNTMY